jgi:hypothetical protein
MSSLAPGNGIGPPRMTSSSKRKVSSYLPVCDQRVSFLLKPRTARRWSSVMPQYSFRESWSLRPCASWTTWVKSPSWYLILHVCQAAMTPGVESMRVLVPYRWSVIISTGYERTHPCQTGSIRNQIKTKGLAIESHTASTVMVVDI